MNPANGRFVWFDLLTPDREAAKAFYADLVGWTAAPFGSDGKYEVLSAGEAPIGGVMPVETGGQPRWLGYIATEDVDGAAERTQRMKGSVTDAPKDIPFTGRYALLKDPLGAEFGVFKSAREGSPPDRRVLSHFNWAELNTTDWKAAWSFYTELFGWKPVSTLQKGAEIGEYVMFGVETKDAFGGMSNAANGMHSPPHWLHYVNVKSVDEAVKKIVRGRGTVLSGPMDVPGGGRIAQCIDPQRARFGIVSM